MKVRYIGTESYQEYPLTGTTALWQPEWVSDVSDYRAGKLVALGTFVYDDESTFDSQLSSRSAELAAMGARLSSAGNRFVLMGDSRNSRSLPKAPGDNGIFNWANIILGQRCNVVLNTATSGQTTTHLLETQLDQARAVFPTHAFILCGTNDIANGVAASVVIANLTAVMDALTQAGVIVFLATEYPASGVYNTAAKRESLLLVNQAIIKYCRNNRNSVCVNFYSALVDAASATGDQISGSLTDNIHPGMSGARILATLLADAIAAFIPAQRRIATSLVDDVSDTYPNGNLITNPVMTGTGGANSGTGMSGVVATDWTHQLVSGTITSVASKVPRTDGVPGDWQRMSMSSSADNSYMRLMHVEAFPAQIVAGTDSIEGFTEVKLSSVVGHIDYVPFFCEFMTAANATISTVFFMTQQTSEDYQDFAGVLWMPPTLVPATTAKARVGVLCQLDNGASCVLDVGQIELRKVVS